MLEGRLRESGELADAALRASADDPDLTIGRGALAGVMRWHQGRRDDAFEVLMAEVENRRLLIIPQARVCLEAMRLAHLADVDRSRELIHRFTEATDPLSYHVFRSILLGFLTEVCSIVGDAEVGAILAEWLVPYAGQLLGAHNLAIVVGSADRFLAMLDATQRNWDDAEAHFRSALELETRMNAPLFVAETSLWYGRMLLERDRPGDRERGVELLTAALAGAKEMGLEFVAREARRFLDQY